MLNYPYKQLLAFIYVVLSTIFSISPFFLATETIYAIAIYVNFAYHICFFVLILLALIEFKVLSWKVNLSLIINFIIIICYFVIAEYFYVSYFSTFFTISLFAYNIIIYRSISWADDFVFLRILSYPIIINLKRVWLFFCIWESLDIIKFIVSYMAAGLSLWELYIFSIIAFTLLGIAYYRLKRAYKTLQSLSYVKESDLEPDSAYLLFKKPVRFLGLYVSGFPPFFIGGHFSIYYKGDVYGYSGSMKYQQKEFKEGFYCAVKLRLNQDEIKCKHSTNDYLKIMLMFQTLHETNYFYAKFFRHCVWKIKFIIDKFCEEGEYARIKQILLQGASNG